MSDVRIRSTIRDRRQLTLPRSVCEALDLDVGDMVELEVEDGYLRVTPWRKRALDALEAIQKAFADSGISEEELLAEGRRVREELTRERYGLGPKT